MGQVLRQVGLCGVDRKKEMREEGKGWDQGQTDQLAYPKISYGPTYFLGPFVGWKRLCSIYSTFPVESNRWAEGVKHVNGIRMEQG